MQLPFAMDGVPKKFMVFSPFNIYERTLFTLWKFCVGSKQFTTSQLCDLWSLSGSNSPSKPIGTCVGLHASSSSSSSVQTAVLFSVLVFEHKILFTYFLLCRLKGCICCRMGWDEMEWLLLLDQIWC